MRFELTRDAGAFADRTDALLSAWVECNVLQTVLRHALRGHFSDPPPLFAWAVDDAGAARFAALRTPPVTNPTSNKIYAEVGYERVGEFEELAFHANGG